MICGLRGPIYRPQKGLLLDQPSNRHMAQIIRKLIAGRRTVIVSAAAPRSAHYPSMMIC